MTPKEALKEIFNGMYNKQGFIKEFKAIEQALTPPTLDEVCKALSEYYLFDMVEYDKKTQTFYSGDNICYMGIDYQDKPIIIFDYELPPHLITLIGRFYQSLKEELK